jgi:hypothetical protein
MNDMMVNKDKTMNADITTGRVTAEPGADRGQAQLLPCLLARLPIPCLPAGLAAAADREGLAR